MMRVLTSFDSIVLAAVVKDLRPLVGGVLTRVVQPGPDELVIELRGRAPAAVVCSIHERWGRVHLGSGDSGTGPLSPFAQLLRGRLDRARLIDVGHEPFERILTLGWDAIRGRADLVAEIMGRHSNLVLVEDGVITGALKAVPRQKSSVREVLPGRRYVPPPRDRQPPTALTTDELGALLTGMDPLAKRLVAAVLGIGPATAREVAVRAGLDPEAPTGAQPDAVSRLWPVLQEFADRVRLEQFEPVLYFDGDAAVGFGPFPFIHLGALRAVRVPTMSAAVEAVMARFGAAAILEAQRSTLRQIVEAALERAQRTHERLQQTVRNGAEAAVLREQGELLLTYASQVPAGGSQVTLPGYDGRPVTITLDPALSAVENAQRIFKRYARTRGARPVMEARLQDLSVRRAYLESARAMIEQASSSDDLFDLRQELVQQGYIRERKAPARPSAAAGPRRFVLASGDIVLVGRTNTENDVLTFRLAGAEDIWLHARGAPGAHVILKAARGRPAAETIRQAAAIAAYFSQGRGAGTVPVAYTERKHVKKPKGSPPGVVTLDRERTIDVTPELPESARPTGVLQLRPRRPRRSP